MLFIVDCIETSLVADVYTTTNNNNDNDNTGNL